MPSISVVVPTYNRAHYLPNLVRSLLRQASVDDGVEIMVVDDGSTDDTASVLARLQSESGRARPAALHFRSQRNQGQAAARDLGVRESTGGTLVFVDDDMEPADEGFLRAHWQEHAAGGDPSTSRKVVLGEILPPKGDPRRPAFEYMAESHFAALYSGLRSGTKQPDWTRFYTGNVSVSRYLYNKAGGFNPSFKHAEDVELGLRLSRKAQAEFVFSERARAHHNSTSRTFASFTERARLYGGYDLAMTEGLPSEISERPFQFLRANSLPTRVGIFLISRSPGVAVVASRALIPPAALAAFLRLPWLAAALCKVIYKIHYIRGMQMRLGTRTLTDRLDQYWKRVDLQGQSPDR